MRTESIAEASGPSVPPPQKAGARKTVELPREQVVAIREMMIEERELALRLRALELDRKSFDQRKSAFLGALAERHGLTGDVEIQVEAGTMTGQPKGG